MRCLMVPQISGGEVQAESDYYSHQTIMKVLTDVEPSHFYVWLDSKQQDKMPPVIPGRFSGRR